MKKPLLILVHGGYWMLYFLLLGVIFSIATILFKLNSPAFQFSTFLPLLTACLLPNFPAFYLSYLILFPKFLAQRKIWQLFLTGAAICLVSALFGNLIPMFFYGTKRSFYIGLTDFSILTVFFFLIAAIHAFIALVIHGFIVWFAEIKLKEELSRKNYEIEMALLKSQLNPHFLFNTINNIDVLITKDSNKASEYLNKLSGILRYLLYDAKTEKISLNEELKYIGKYLELQKIRTTNPDYVIFEVVGEANGLQIAPMIFFPFIENAFKHTENDKKFNSISLRIVIHEKRINFDCTNTFQKRTKQKQEFGGLGNELIQKRLVLLYPDKHSLEIGVCEGIYKVKLSLDLHEN